MSTPDYGAILARHYPDSLWRDASTYERLVDTWEDPEPPPTKDALDALWPSVAEDLAWVPIRARRNSLLAASDWAVLPDSPLGTEARDAWAAYRATLRNIPQTYETPADVVWPQSPE